MKKISKIILVIILSIIIVGIFAFVLQENNTKEDFQSSQNILEEKVYENIDQSISKKSNVLLIILDDIGLDYFPGFLEDQGFVKARMPVIENLMDNGFVFDNLHTYATCSPTRASLLTGKHGTETGVLDPGRTSHLHPKWQGIQ